MSLTVPWQRIVPLLLLFLSNGVVGTRRDTVYISEFSYNQLTGDFVELVGPKDWQFVNTFLSFYTASSNNSTGVLFDIAPLNPSVVEETSSSSSKILESQSVYVYRSEDVPELSDTVAVGAIALSVIVSGVSTTLHYVSYGGTFNTTQGGLADGLVPDDVGVVESTDDGENDVTSIQLEVESETWESRCSTPGRANRALLNRAEPLNFTVTPARPWINEFHYTDASGGTNVFIEVAGPEKMPIEGYVLSVYQASPGGSATLLQCIELEESQLVDNVVNTVAFLSTSDLGIPNSIDKVTAIALSANMEAGNLYDYVSFNGIGGSAPSSTLNGPAAGSLPTDVLVQESFPETAVGTSLQRQDVPLCLNDDAAMVIWSDGVAESPGSVNVNQQDSLSCSLQFNPWIVTDAPTLQPSLAPTFGPTRGPTMAPTSRPTLRPTARPSVPPTSEPTSQPSVPPTFKPSSQPTLRPTESPTVKPTLAPTTHTPTIASTSSPTFRPSPPPSPKPSAKPSPEPSKEPTHEPTREPTHHPSSSPSAAPSADPSAPPSAVPFPAPSSSPSAVPSSVPSSSPSVSPSSAPTVPPTFLPTASPTACANDEAFRFLDLISRRFEDCDWIQEKTARQETYCFLDGFGSVAPIVIRQSCPQACGLCPAADGVLPPLVQLSPICPFESTDNTDFRFSTKNGDKPCRFIAKKRMRIRKFCKKRRIRRNCPFSCRGCTELQT